MWLDKINLALDQAVKPVRFFFRNDDAGWAEKRLFELLNCFSEFQIPIDLAVIPLAIDNQNRALCKRVVNSKNLVGVHQHGYSHCNYQLQGRKCEFGSDRDYYLQQTDIKKGRDFLLDYFSGQVDPIFTPPWNRCNQSTVKALFNLGFDILSRDNTAQPLNCRIIQELPVNIDWFKKHKGARLSQYELGQQLVQFIARGDNVGIMLHHKIMDHHERNLLSELLELLDAHPMVKCQRMKDIVTTTEERDLLTS